MKIYFSLFSRFNAIFPAARDSNFDAEEEDISIFKQHVLYYRTFLCFGPVLVYRYVQDLTYGGFRCSN